MGHDAAPRAVATRFEGFGPTAIAPFHPPLQSLSVTRHTVEMRRAMRDRCPVSPGVYGAIDRRRQLIYVGMSAALRKRLITYFQGGSTLRKEHCIASHARRIVWEDVGHELIAQLRELELIRRHQPRFNVRGREPERPLGYIYFSREDAPRCRAGRRVPKAVRYSWGPLRINWRIREAVELVNRLFKLCDCPPTVPMHFADQAHLFPLDLRFQCLRGEMGTCLGPCAGNCTFLQYSAQLRAARAFLDGRDTAPLQRLGQQLDDAARSQQYERASRLRDTLDRAQYLWDQLAMLRSPPLPVQCVYPVQLGCRPVWYLITFNEVIATTAAPTSEVTAQECLHQLGRVFASEHAERAEVDRPAAQIVSSWFRMHPHEAATLLSPDEAHHRCRQLRAAM
jgi:excinuclease ABC subunit C